MYIRSKIILIALCVTSCKNKPVNEFETPYIDSALSRSAYNTSQFKSIISDVDSVESLMWTSVGNKIDSLKDENKALKKRLNWRPKIIDQNGKVKELPTIEELRNKRRKKLK